MGEELGSNGCLRVGTGGMGGNIAGRKENGGEESEEWLRVLVAASPF